MKFRKEYESQMVHEWEEHYLDYKYVNTLLEGSRHLKRPKNCFCRRNGSDDGVKKVNLRGVEGHFETKVEERRAANEHLFFRKLDDEFYKVNEFYRTMVEEVKKEASLLNKQMDVLIAFRIEVEKIHRSSNITATPASDSIPAHHNGGKIHMDITKQNGINTERNYEYLEENTDILSNMKIKIRSNVPYSTVKCFPNIYTETELDYSIENLKIVEGQLECAFMDFYRKLLHLKDYSLLNRSATYKILEKYHKVKFGSSSTSHSYLGIIGSSSIGNSDEVLRIMESVEDAIIKHFSYSNILRVKAEKEKPVTTISSGLFTGCTVTLVVALIPIIHLRRLVKKEGFDQYMNTMFPLYSLFGFLVLHMVMYASNIYFWRLYHINYSFIFGLKRGTELGYRDVLFLGASLATLTLAIVVANLDMEKDRKTKDYQAFTELLPLGLLILVVFTTLCPFNIIYRSTRFSLLHCVFRCVCAPVYKSSFLDWFLSDQLTSQFQALRSLEFYVCYYGWGDIKQRQNTCKSEGVYKNFYAIVALLPFLSRILQCFRHSVLEGDSIQGFNGLKHFTTIVAVLMRTASVQGGGQVWWVGAMVTSVIAALYCIYWDLVQDCGVVQWNSKNRWLRDRLILPHKWMYYLYMVLNILLRFAWLQTLLNIKVSFLHKQTSMVIVASRGIWNFFSLENEHLKLIGTYGEYASVPSLSGIMRMKIRRNKLLQLNKERYVV